MLGLDLLYAEQQRLAFKVLKVRFPHLVGSRTSNLSRVKVLNIPIYDILSILLWQDPLPPVRSLRRP